MGIPMAHAHGNPSRLVRAFALLLFAYSPHSPHYVRSHSRSLASRVHSLGCQSNAHDRLLLGLQGLLRDPIRDRSGSIPFASLSSGRTLSLYCFKFARTRIPSAVQRLLVQQHRNRLVPFGPSLPCFRSIMVRYITRSPLWLVAVRRSYSRSVTPRFQTCVVRPFVCPLC